MNLFRYFTLPYWRQRPLKTLLTILGMASGIAVYSAIDLANRSALRSFEASVTRISGEADLSVVGSERRLVDEDYRRVLENPHTAAATPWLEARGRCVGSGTEFSLWGVDPLSRGGFFSTAGPAQDARPWLDMMAQPRLALLSRDLAAACGVRDGENFAVLLNGREVRLQARLLAGSDPWPAGKALFVDIATAQEILDRRGGLDRIEVRARPGEIPAWLEATRSGFPPGLAFPLQAERLERGRDLLRAFQLNLLSLGLVAVFVAVFIVYNSLSLSLLHRRSDLAVLRSLGARRGQLTASFAWEASLLGLGSGLLGILLGGGLAKLLFSQVARTVHNLYLGSTELRLFADPRGWLVALGLALGASLLGAAIPLLEVFSLSPAESVRRLGYERHLRRHPRWLAGAAIAMFGVAVLTARLSSIAHPGWGFVTAFAVLTGFLTLTPGVLGRGLNGLTRLAGGLRWGGAQVACAQAAENPYRFGVVTAALALGVALWLGVSLMVGSFRGTVVDWIAATIRGDLYLTLGDNPGNRFRSFLPEEFVQRVEGLSGVTRRDRLRVIPASLDGQELRVSGVELRELSQRGQFKILSGKQALSAEFPGQPAPAAVSESLARRHGLKVGDTLRLSTEWGPWELRVAAILYDYSSERGVLYVERRDFAAFSGDARVQGIALYLDDPARAETLAREIRGWPGLPPTLEVRLNREVRERIMRIFDETFEVTAALKLVALFVAFLGILTTLSILAEERRREIGLLQALGTSPAQLAGYGLSQGAALGACGGLLGAACGIALCWVILRVIQYDHFGWTIFFRFEPVLVLESLGLTMGVAILATVWPLRYLMKIQPSEALRFEE